MVRSALKSQRYEKLFSTHYRVLRYQKVLCREAALWKMIDHPNVLELIGICRLDDVRFQDHPALISPFATNGTLLGYVSKYENASRVGLVRHLHLKFLQ